jgi:hypothetical protein
MEPRQIKLIRLLNTTNAGLNDFAAVKYDVELLDKNETPVWSKRLFSAGRGTGRSARPLPGPSCSNRTGESSEWRDSSKGRET